MGFCFGVLFAAGNERQKKTWRIRGKALYLEIQGLSVRCRSLTILRWNWEEPLIPPWWTHGSFVGIGTFLAFWDAVLEFILPHNNRRNHHAETQHPMLWLHPRGCNRGHWSRFGSLLNHTRSLDLVTGILDWRAPYLGKIMGLRCTVTHSITHYSPHQIRTEKHI